MKTRHAALLLIVSAACLGCRTAQPGWHRELVPALEGSREISGWLSQGTVVIRDKDSRERAVSLTGRAAPSLPTLPPLGGPEPAPNRRFLSRSLAYPSPDGKWLLYWEQELQTGTDTTTPTGERWRLVSRRGEKTRLWPADGKLSRKPQPTLYMWHPEVLWLPDSSGWSVLRSASGPAELYRVSTVEKGSQQLPLPEKEVDTLLGQRRDGTWLWLPEGSNGSQRLRFLTTNAPTPLPLSIPGDLSAALSWPYTLSTATDTLAITVSRRAALWNKFLKQEEITEIGLFPLSGGVPLFLTFPDKIVWVQSLHWSPDGKRLLCLINAQTTPNAPMVSKAYLFRR